MHFAVCTMYYYYNVSIYAFDGQPNYYRRRSRFGNNCHAGFFLQSDYCADVILCFKVVFPTVNNLFCNPSIKAIWVEITASPCHLSWATPVKIIFGWNNYSTMKLTQIEKSGDVQKSRHFSRGDWGHWSLYKPRSCWRFCLSMMMISMMNLVQYSNRMFCYTTCCSKEQLQSECRLSLGLLFWKLERKETDESVRPTLLFPLWQLQWIQYQWIQWSHSGSKRHKVNSAVQNAMFEKSVHRH